MSNLNLYYSCSSAVRLLRKLHCQSLTRFPGQEIRDGPYNRIKEWDYTALARSLDNGEGRLAAFKARQFL